MMNECIPVDQLGTLKQASEDDPRRQHAASCPRCSSLLFAYEEFVRANERADASERAGANVAEAEAALARFIAAHIEAAPGERIAGAPRPGRGRWFDFSLLRMTAALAAVVLVAVVLVRWQPWESRSIVYRGDQKAQFSGLSAARAGDGSVDLHWGAVPNADAYRVTILGADLTEITRLDPTPSLTARLGAAEKGYYWQVTALEEGAEILTSDPQRLP
jgi:hypothetical protein